MNAPELSDHPMPDCDQGRTRLTRDGVPKTACILATFGVALILAACAVPVRPGPVVDSDAPTPFKTADGPTPTQAQAQAAVDAAVRRDGLPGVFPQFTALAPGRGPTRITLFACGSARGAAPRRRPTASVSATCHVDVLDRNDDLVGRTTMRFAREHGVWVLIADRERELDAR